VRKESQELIRPAVRRRAATVPRRRGGEAERFMGYEVSGSWEAADPAQEDVGYFVE
jgi:hypothetical protein